MNGVLGARELLVQNQAAAIYVCAREQATLVTLSITNKDLEAAQISVAISLSQTEPADSDWIEYEVTIERKGTLVRTGLYVPQGYYLVVRSNRLRTNAICWGVEIGAEVDDIAPVIEDPTYSLAAAAASVNEGSALTFNVSGSNISDGVYYWTVSRPEDFLESSGSFTITANTGSFSVTPTADLTTEGAETFTAFVRTGSVSGPIVATSTAVTINDTSLAPTVVTSSTRAFTVAQSTSSGIFTTDGITWTETTLPASGVWLDTNYNPAAPGRACALRWGGAAYSTNYGETWLAATGMGGGGGTVNALAPVTPTVWITVGNSTAEYFRSTDNGQTWSLQNFGFLYEGNSVAGVGAGLAVVVTNSLNYYTTTDGLTFTPRTFPTNPTGSTNWNRVVHLNGLYVALQNVNNGRYIMTSPDGTNWTVRDVTLGAASANFGKAISFGGNLPGTWLIVSEFTSVYWTSTDLVTWTSRSLSSNKRWNGIAWINDRWVATIDASSAADNVKATSTDGINWIESPFASTHRRWCDLTEVR